jgi:hypothetical protein
MNLANEGLEARKKEEEITSRKRKAEEDKTWEGTSNYSVEFFNLHKRNNNFVCVVSYRHP